MTKEELLTAIETVLRNHSDVQSAGRIDGESAVGVEFRDGSEFFIEVQDA